jgi:hypothetical protein
LSYETWFQRIGALKMSLEKQSSEKEGENKGGAKASMEK